MDNQNVITDFNSNNSLIIKNLLEEFFEPNTANFRKHEIEMQLLSIKSTPNIERVCLQLLINSPNHYVTMFALQTLETVINQHWNKVNVAVQDEIKNTLQCSITFRNCSLPNYLRNKYIKLLVDIAIIDWPHKYMNFLNDILTLLKSSDSNQLIGLLLLKTTFEEFLNFNKNFDNTNRENELTKSLHEYIPVIFEILTSIVEKTAMKTTTANALSPNLQSLSLNECHGGEIYFNIKETLVIVQNIFTWVPLEAIPRPLIRNIFSIAKFLVQTQQDEDIFVHAISAINEIFYRKCCPPGSEDFFVEMYDHVFVLFQITKNTPWTNSEKFNNKLYELSGLIIEQHFYRIEKASITRITEFMDLFLDYSILRTQKIVYFWQYLNLWITFLKYAKSHEDDRYAETIMRFGYIFIKKIQFSHNSTLLNELKREVSDQSSDEKSEWVLFLETCVEVVSQLVQSIPLILFRQVVDDWMQFTTDYGVIQTHSDIVSLTDEKTKLLCDLFRDFATLTLLLRNIAHHFCNKEDAEIKTTFESITPVLIEKTFKCVAHYRSIKSLILLSASHLLKQVFYELQSQLLCSMKTWFNWMYDRTEYLVDVGDLLKVIYSYMMDTESFPLWNLIAASELFLEISKKPEVLMPSKHGEIMDLIHKVHFLKLQRPVYNNICSAICEILFRPLVSLDEDAKHQCRHYINLFFKELSQNFMVLELDSQKRDIINHAGYILPTLTHILKYCNDFPACLKKELAAAIRPILDQALFLFPTCAHLDPTLDQDYYNFFISTFEDVQIGAEMTKKTVQTFLQVAISEQQSNSFTAVTELLKILCIIVKDINNKSFLPDILRLSMDDLYGLLLPKIGECPDVFVIFLELLYSILNFHWLYFYNSQVALGYSPGCSDTDAGPDVPKRPDELLVILRVFGEALLCDDINIFKKSLNILENLNRNKRLYCKTIFRTNFLQGLVQILLNTLLYRKQDISREDVACAIYNMVEVDFDGFFSTFLPNYIRGLDGVTPQQFELMIGYFSTIGNDIPSFQQHLRTYANDFQRFRM